MENGSQGNQSSEEDEAKLDAAQRIVDEMQTYSRGAPPMPAADWSKPMEPIPAGSLITFTTGEYSDYHVIGAFRALRDIDGAAIFELWRAERSEERLRGSYENQFISWAARRGDIELVDCFDWHIAIRSDPDRCASDISKIDNN